jgi:signal transduction histidine kinase
LAGTTAGLFLALAPAVWGQALNPQPEAAGVLTNIAEIWNVPREHQDEEYRIRTEVVIYYFDPEWQVAWGECQGIAGWLPISDSPIPLKAGQRVALDGVVIPLRQRFVWAKTRIRILEEKVGVKAETVLDPGSNPKELKGRWVSVEGLIDSEADGSTHCKFNLLSGSTLASVFVLKETNRLSVPFKEGDFVRMKCVYSSRYDRNGNLNGLDFWVNGLADIEVIGSLKTNARFAIPLTLSEDIRAGAPAGTVVRVAGIVRSYEPGKEATLWDAAGQITVQSKQSLSLRFGDQVEAIGYPDQEGMQHILHDSLYRLADQTNTTVSAGKAAPNTSPLPLRLAGQIRELSPEEARRHLPVNLRVMVAWGQTNTPFAYVLDASGGIRVANPKWGVPNTMIPGTMAVLKGVTCEGAFVPEVTNATLRLAGWADLVEPRLVTFDQALTGAEEGNWVEMRGFVRDVRLANGLAHFDLSTPSGEFQAWTPATQSFDSFKGSIIRVRGVCAAVANARHQLTGIQIWTPDVKYIQTEESAPDDLFSVPLRPLASLRRFNMETALNQRIRTSGTVVLHVPGRYLYVQDGMDSIFALSQQPDVLHPGDQVEVVGFPGREGRKFILREAVYRRLANGREPRPVELSATNSADVNLDGLLAKADGVLLNRVEEDGETHLFIQTGNFTFEAGLNSAAVETKKKLQALALGSRLALTGVYEMQRDEYGQPHSFLLHLRSWNDVQLLRQPPWWTQSRLLRMLVGILAVFLIALIWGLLMARKNALLNRAQAELKTANDQLEIRVADRTRALLNQVAAREAARTELAQAQRSLMLASREAGMAEVATGVLHNVGNVLNSVNVSATLLHDQVRTSETRALLKAAALLQQKNGDWDAFLTSDPQGKLMPEFIIQIAGQLQKEQENTLCELEQLAKNIDHIKVIVSMQQSYARVAGVVETVVLASLVEDALQINAAALTRHEVTVVRHFEAVPSLMVDKQKVLQILINLISNAQYALDKCPRAGKRLIITIAKTDTECVRIRMQDTGMGIPPENLTRIFSHGFTTRPDGHGFGLHLGALNAREMGGSLAAASAGAGYGATFDLILPIQPPVKIL